MVLELMVLYSKALLSIDGSNRNRINKAISTVKLSALYMLSPYILSNILSKIIVCLLVMES